MSSSRDNGNNQDISIITTCELSSDQQQLQQSTTTTLKPKIFAPSRFVVDAPTGKKYRLCAAAAVLNSHNQLLVGERLTIPGAWQAPQGGVNAACPNNKDHDESIVDAACRELYEEMGLQLHRHVVVQSSISDPHQHDALAAQPGSGSKSNGIRYETTGTSNWLTKAGFAGQELHWVIFRCVHGRGDAHPDQMCDLAGKGGESPEFGQVTWKPLPQVVDEMWPAKRGPYEALATLLTNYYIPEWTTLCHQGTSELAGYWTRDNALSQNIVPALMARGMTKEQAENAATAPYRQRWAPITTTRDDTSKNAKSTTINTDSSSTPAADSLPAWQVTTYAEDGVTPRRTLVYPWGTWQETYPGESTLFGKAEGTNGVATLQRRTFYAPQPLYTVQPQDNNNTREHDNISNDMKNPRKVAMAHVTVTTTPNGDIEEARRYRDGQHLILQRTFWSHNKDNTCSTSKVARGDNGNGDGSTTANKNDGIVSVEVFLRYNESNKF